MMKLKKYLVMLSILVITVMAVTGCGSNAGDETTASAKETTESGDEIAEETIAAASISIDDKYLEWTAEDYKDASAEEKIDVYSTYIYYAGEALGLSEEMTDDEVKAEIAKSYTESLADEYMEELFAFGDGVTIKEAIAIGVADYEAQLDALLESGETTTE